MNPLTALWGFPPPPEAVPAEAPPEYVRANSPSSFGPIAGAQAAATASAPPPHKGGIGHAIGSALETMLGMSHVKNLDRIDRNNTIAKLMVAEAMKPGAPPEALEAAMQFGKAAGWDNDAMSQTRKLYEMKAKAEADYAEYIRRKESLNRQPPLGQTPPQPIAQNVVAPQQPPLNSPFLQPQPAATPSPQAAPQPAAGPAPGQPFQNPALMQNVMANRTLPKPPFPFSQGAVQAGPTPMPANPVIGRTSSAASTGAGFGGAVTSPSDVPEMADPAMRGNLFNYGPQAEGRRIAAQTRPGLEMQGDVARSEAEKNYQAAYDRFKDQPWFKGLTERQQAAVLTGVNVTAEPHFNIPGITNSEAGDIDKDGKPVAPGIPGRRSYVNGQWMFTPEQGRLVFKMVTNADGSRSQQAFNGYTGQAVGAPTPMAPPVLTLKKIVERDGTTKLAPVNVVTGQLGAPMDPRLFGVDPAFVANVSTAGHINMVPQPDGSIVPVFGETTTTTQKGGGLPPQPGMTPPPESGTQTPAVGTTPAGAATGGTQTPAAGTARARITGQGQPVGGKALTPGQQITFRQKQSAFDNTIDLVKSVQSKMPMLNSLIDAKKIEMQIDPQQGIIKAFINRNVPLSEEEAKLAGDFASLMEHINTLRGPLAATGFRGHEAWSALQQQRGQLTANPAVTTQVLSNTLKALVGQREAIAGVLSGKNKQVPVWAGSLPNVGFKDGSDEYHIPPDKVDAFMTAHPNAVPLKE